MALFSIYRFSISMEMLAPLVVWLVAHKLLTADMAKRVATVTLALVATHAVASVRTWGHAGWDTRAFRVVVPDLPTSGTILLIGSETPNGWMAPFFPPKMAVVGLGTHFPEGPAFNARVREIVEQRGGKAWGVVPAHSNEQEAALMARMNGALATLALSASGWPCRGLSALLQRVSKRLRVDEASSAGSCRVAFPEGTMSVAKADRATVQRSDTIVVRYGLALDAASCRTYEASVGAKPRPYQLCEVELRPDSL